MESCVFVLESQRFYANPYKNQKCPRMRAENALKLQRKKLAIERRKFGAVMQKFCGSENVFLCRFREHENRKPHHEARKHQRPKHQIEPPRMPTKWSFALPSVKYCAYETLLPPPTGNFIASVLNTKFETKIPSAKTTIAV